MKKDSLVIDGKTFISSRRASEIAAYSKDYVGQLCREGKLDCRRINRLWWVNESSVRKHADETVKANHTSFRSADVALVRSYAEKMAVAADESAAAKVSAGIAISEISSGSVRSQQAAHSPFERKFIFMSGFAIAIVLVFATVSAFSFLKTPSTISESTANAYSSASGEQSFFGYVWSSIAGIFFGSRTETQSGSLAVNESQTESASDLSQPQAGLVVVPSQGSTTDAKMAQTITNSFSDSVSVAPAANGASGVITPEFRTVKGHDYLYVLVPVKASSTTVQN